MIGVTKGNLCSLLLTSAVCLTAQARTAEPRPGSPSAPQSPSSQVPSGSLGVPIEGPTGWPQPAAETLPREVAPEVVIPSLAQPQGANQQGLPSSGSPLRAGQIQNPIAPASTSPAARIDLDPARGLAAGLPPASAFRSLGGIAIWWRLTVFGPQGESMATREFGHRLDASVSDRDRIEYSDGRVYGRLGLAVFAQRNRMPWLTLVEPASHELDLFGLHARLPYALADGQRWIGVGSRREAHGSETWEVACFEGRASTGSEPIGPAPGPGPKVDRFELCSPVGGGLPREFRLVLAASGQPRRVRLEDWREVAGVPIPFRRIYVDESGRPTTQVEVLRFEPGATTSDRDFRLD